MEYQATIGLEVHAELATKQKMFCSSKNEPLAEKPNTNICPICLAHPGTLPTINKEAVRQVLRMGAAIGGTLADFSEFDRKSYFYPDIPKGYQISQYEHPLIRGGVLNGVAITRIHLEEDTARSSHAGGSSLVDFNRAGVPLMELVTEPVMHDAKTAANFARELQLLLRTLGSGEANLEKGEMRVEANVSVSKVGEPRAKKYVEIKNINSFRSVERAIDFEIKRQIELIESGGAVEQETRGWDEGKQQTFHQRFKEGSADYRYFPEPDLPKLLLSEIPEFSLAVLTASLPELPTSRRARYTALGLREADIEFLISTVERTDFFDAVLVELSDVQDASASAANYFISDLAGSAGKSTPSNFAKLMRMLVAQTLSSRGAKDTLAVMVREGGNPEEIAAAQGLLQVHDEGALARAVRSVIEANPTVVAEYRAGKTTVLQYLIGQAMKATKGAGSPGALKELLTKELT